MIGRNGCFCTPLDAEPGVLEVFDETDYQKEKDDAQADGEADSHPPHEGLLVRSHPLGLEGDIEQVVEAQDSLEENEQEEGEQEVHWDQGMWYSGSSEKGGQVQTRTGKAEIAMFQIMPFCLISK